MQTFILKLVIDSASVFGCLLAADFIAGLLHWAEDTWTAPGASPLLDRWIVRDNIEHHRTPGAIRAGDYWGTNRVCIALAALAAALLAACGVHAWQAYLVLFFASQSNQIHMWAHTSNPPRAVAWLQRAGILQSAAHHAKHHKRPYAGRYCTTTSFLNPLLDRAGFWRAAEGVLIRCGASVYRATPARGGY